MTSTPVRSAVAEMLIISPQSPPSSSARRRRITPSSEASSAKSTAVVTSPGAIASWQTHLDRSAIPNPLGWPAIVQQALIHARLPLPNPLLQPQPLLPPPRDIILPFDLHADRGAFNKKENRDMLWNLYQGTASVGTDGRFLGIFLKTLPPKPWPKTVAGLPVYFGPESGPSAQHSPMPNARLVSREGGHIAKDVNGGGIKDWEPIFILIKDHFRNMGIAITEVMNLGNDFMIVLEHRSVDFTKLPWRAANMGCLYLFDDEMGRPVAPQARRLADPTPGNPDHSSYDTLQPGVRVASAYLPSDAGKFLSTSAGVLVRDQVGNEFMTVASHGFPAECGTDQVMHPLPSLGRNIGKLIMEVSHTDIALVELRDTESFSNVSFCNNEMPEPIQLRRLVEAESLGMQTNIALDSPDTGFIYGKVMWNSFSRVPVDDMLEPEQSWIFTTWSYMGQGSAATLPEGMCGSAIWTEDGDVVGFFRYAPKEGEMKDWCAGIAADELIKRGFSLVDTTQRLP